MMKLLASTSLALLLTSCAGHGEPTARPPAPAATPAPETAGATLPAQERQRRESLLTLFRAYEYVPKKTDFERLGTPAEVVASLTALAEDPTASPHIRIQSLAGMAYFPGPDSQRVLEKAITAPDTSDVVRRSALRAYGAGFSDSAVPLLAKYLDHTDMHSRMAAVKALGHIKTESAALALRRRLPAENESLVKASIETELGHMNQAGIKPAKPRAR